MIDVIQDLFKKVTGFYYKSNLGIKVGNLSAYTNAYADMRINMPSGAIPTNNNEISYQDAQKMLEKQMEMAAIGGSYYAMNYALLKNKIPYLPRNVAPNTVIDPKSLQSNIGRSKHVLITFFSNLPSINPDEKPVINQLYYGRNEKTKTCFLFAPTMHPPGREGDCSSIIELMADNIAKTIADDATSCHIAVSL